MSIEKSWLRLDVSLDAVKMYIESIIETSGGHLRQDVTLDQVHQEVTLDPVRQDGTLSTPPPRGHERARAIITTTKVYLDEDD